MCIVNPAGEATTSDTHKRDSPDATLHTLLDARKYQQLTDELLCANMDHVELATISRIVDALTEEAAIGGGDEAATLMALVAACAIETALSVTRDGTPVVSVAAAHAALARLFQYAKEGNTSVIDFMIALGNVAEPYFREVSQMNHIMLCIVNDMPDDIDRALQYRALASVAKMHVSEKIDGNNAMWIMQLIVRLVDRTGCVLFDNEESAASVIALVARCIGNAASHTVLRVNMCKITAVLIHAIGKCTHSSVTALTGLYAALKYACDEKKAFEYPSNNARHMLAVLEEIVKRMPGCIQRIGDTITELHATIRRMDASVPKRTRSV